ncbi:MAG TPA: PP2C family serine/threonine-protein phosphatase [Blastocatellia bacterium]|nr:PP2C family serine/threonine-protein phosphatase [Blastocatellia bacterium]
MWKYGFASVIGTWHARAGVPLQDASRATVIRDARGAELLLAAVSDGAGSAAQSHIGSRLACEFWLEAVTEHCAAGGTLAELVDGFVPRWLMQCQQRFAQTAQVSGFTLEDYACTFLAAVVGAEEAVYVQLGDGAMIEAAGDDYNVVCWPQQGEYANSTNFLTDADAANKCFVERRKQRVDEVALFTDGVQSLVLDYRTRTAHAPFFAPLFAWLRPRGTGHSQELSQSLDVYLNSAKINARTDDDKTLILATRRI